MKLAIIGGTGLWDCKLFSRVQPSQVHTEFGAVEVCCWQQACFLQRHASGVPPHRINHHANIAALKQLGIQRVIGVGSCGSLDPSVKPGELVIPHDYINFYGLKTFFHQEMGFTIPGLNRDLRELILQAAEKNQMSLLKQGVYLQTQGPRLETPAEIRMFAQFADILGMTLAHEMTLAKELGLAYAAICSVDNYCNGVADKPLSHTDIQKNAAKNREKVEQLLDHIINVEI